MKSVAINQFIKFAAFSALALLGVSGCDAPPSAPAQSGTKVTFRTAIDNSSDRSSSGSSSHGVISASGSSVDSIEVTSAGFFVSNMLFFSNTDGDQTDLNRTETILRTDQFILDFESWGKQYIGDRIIAPSTYRSIRFTMKAADGGIDYTATLGTVYNTFFAAAPGSTVIIRGNLWTNGQKMPFEYRSQMSGNELAVFDNVFAVPAGEMPKEVDIQLRTSVAFSASTGVLMDPRDGRNSATIEANLRSALKAILGSEGS